MFNNPPAIVQTTFATDMECFSQPLLYCLEIAIYKNNS